MKQFLYQIGPLAAYHRARNRRALTVVTFHRVLDRDDPRYAYCDLEYTISADVFAQCLDFFRLHYNPVSLEQLLTDGADLPDRPLLITLDDGWADHEQVALPLLAERDLPAVVFVASDAVDAQEPTLFWEMRLIHAFRRGTLRAETMETLWRAAGDDAAPAFRDLDELRSLINRLEGLDPLQVLALMEPFEAELATPDRHLLTGAELHNLRRRGVAIGGHGGHHQPLARVAEAAADIRRARAALAERLAEPVACMSFPHGSYDRTAIAAARAAGFQLLFTNDKVLNPVPRGKQPPSVLGRLSFDPADVSDAQGNLRLDRLAFALWRRPHLLLSHDGGASAA